MINPLADRVVVKVKSVADKTTASGLVIPQIAQDEKPTEGTVMAVGPGRWESGTFIPTELTQGDTVLFSKFAGVTLTANDEDILVLTERDVLCTITEGEK